MGKTRDPKKQHLPGAPSDVSLSWLGVLARPIEVDGRGKAQHILPLSNKDAIESVNTEDSDYQSHTFEIFFDFWRNRKELFEDLTSASILSANNFTRRDLLNATGWRRAKIQGAFRDKIQSELQTETGRERIKHLRHASISLKKVSEFEIGGTKRSGSYPQELGYCPEASITSLRRALRYRTGTEKICERHEGEIAARFVAFEGNEKVDKAYLEYNDIILPAIRLLTALHEAHITHIPAEDMVIRGRLLRSKSKSLHVSCLIGPRRFETFVWILRSLRAFLDEGIDTETAAYIREESKKWRHILAARVRSFEPKSLQSDGDPCDPCSMGGASKAKDDAEKASKSTNQEFAEKATDKAIVRLQKLRPTAPEKEVDWWTDLICQSQQTLPQQPEVFVEKVNGFLTTFNYAIENDRGEQCILCVNYDQNSEPYLQLRAGSKGDRRGFKRTSIKLVPATVATTEPAVGIDFE